MSILKKLTSIQLATLTANGVAAAKAIDDDGDTHDAWPVVRLYVNDNIQWLISEFHFEANQFFGLCDLGQGFPELGYVSVDELDSLGSHGVQIDRAFQAKGNLTAYLEAARRNQAITLIL